MANYSNNDNLRRILADGRGYYTDYDCDNYDYTRNNDLIRTTLGQTASQSLEQKKMSEAAKKAETKAKIEALLCFYNNALSQIPDKDTKFTITTKSVGELVSDMVAYDNTQFVQIFYNNQFWASISINLSRNEFDYLIDSKFTKLLEELDKNKEISYKATKKSDDIVFFIEYLDEIRMKITEYFLG